MKDPFRGVTTAGVWTYRKKNHQKICQANQEQFSRRRVNQSDNAQ